MSYEWDFIVKCYGLTKDPLNGNYMLVMQQMDTDLRKYRNIYNKIIINLHEKKDLK